MAASATDPVAKMIVCDIPEAYLSYVLRVEDPNMYDPFFVEFLSLLIALRVGPGLRMSSQLLREVKNDFLFARSQAMAATQNERSADIQPESARIAYRG
jgi:hypothetical protein